MRAEIKLARGALREAKEKDDFDAQISGQMLLLSLNDAADRDDERTLRSARRHLAEAHAARRKALLTYVRLLS
jgi:hypothetical protein